MRVIVTGSSGLLGRHVAAGLVQAGHDVVGIDVIDPPAALFRHFTCDLTDFAAALQLVRDCEAVVHIAAIPRPTGLTAGEVFHTNVALAYNVTEAAVLGHAKRLVYASSFSVLGYPFGEPFLPPRYLPIDIGHPVGPQDPYGLSKWLGEEIVEAAVRRGKLSAVSLRMPWIQSASTFFEQVEPRRQGVEAVRDLWSYLDVRDAVEAFRLALEWKGQGHLRTYISAGDTYLERETEAALTQALPDVPRSPAWAGHVSLIDTSHAAEALGFRPRHSWRDYSAELGT